MDQQMKKRIDDLFTKWQQGMCPGGQVVVRHKGELIYDRCFGYANIELGVPVTDKTVFHVASVSKQLTVMAIMLLHEDGKLNIDEAKLRQAIENDPQKVADIFTKTTSGPMSAGTSDAGIMARIDYVMDKYTSTSITEFGTRKGLLIERAGHESAALSLSNNSIYREMQRIDSQIKALQTKLAAEEARYAKQFASLETYISRMNEQSSWLSSFGLDY